MYSMIVTRVCWNFIVITCLIILPIIDGSFASRNVLDTVGDVLFDGSENSSTEEISDVVDDVVAAENARRSALRLQVAEKIQIQSSEFFRSHKRPSVNITSASLEPHLSNKVIQRLYTADIFQDNIIFIIGYLLRLSDGVLHRSEYLALEIIYNAFKQKTIYMYSMLSILSKLKNMKKSKQFDLILSQLTNVLPEYQRCAAEFLRGEIHKKIIDIDTLLLSTVENLDFLAGINPEKIKVCAEMEKSDELPPYDSDSTTTSLLLGPVYVNLFKHLSLGNIKSTQSIVGLILRDLPNSDSDPVFEEYILYIIEIMFDNKFPNWEIRSQDLKFQNPYTLVVSLVNTFCHDDKVQLQLKMALVYIKEHFTTSCKRVVSSSVAEAREITRVGLDVDLLLKIVIERPSDQDFSQLKQSFRQYLLENINKEIKDIIVGMNRHKYMTSRDLMLAFLARLQIRLPPKNKHLTIVSSLMSHLMFVMNYRDIVKPSLGTITFWQMIDALYDSGIDVEIMQMMQVLKIQMIQHVEIWEELRDEIMPNRCECNIPSSCVYLLLEKLRQSSLVEKFPSILIQNMNLIVTSIREDLQKHGYQIPKVSIPSPKIHKPLVAQLPPTSPPKQKPVVVVPVPKPAPKQDVVISKPLPKPVVVEPKPPAKPMISVKIPPIVLPLPKSPPIISNPTPQQPKTPKQNFYSHLPFRVKSKSKRTRQPPQVEITHRPLTGLYTGLSQLDDNLADNRNDNVNENLNQNINMNINTNFNSGGKLGVDRDLFFNKPAAPLPPISMIFDKTPSLVPGIHADQCIIVDPKFDNINDFPLIATGFEIDQSTVILPPMTDLQSSPSESCILEHVKSTCSKYLKINIMIPLKSIFGNSFTMTLIGKNWITMYPTRLAALLELLRAALKREEVKANYQLTVAAALTLQVLQLVAPYMFLPMISRWKRFNIEIIWSTINIRHQTQTVIGNAPPPVQDPGTITLPLVNPVYWLLPIDRSCDPFPTMLPKLSSQNRYANQLKPLIKIFHWSKITRIFGRQIDLTRFPNRGALFIWTLMYLKRVPAIKANSRLLKVIHYYLQVILKPAIYLKIPQDVILESVGTVSGRWTVDLLGLMRAVPEPLSEPDKKMWQLLSNFLSRINLLDSLGIPLPPKRMECGIFLKKIIQTALTATNLKIDSETRTALVYYQDKIFVSGQGADNIIWVWYKKIMYETEIYIGEILRNLLPFETLAINEQHSYNQLIEYFRMHPEMLTSQDFPLHQYKTMGSFVNAYFDYLLIKPEIDNDAKQCIKTLKIRVPFSGRGAKILPSRRSLSSLPLPPE